MAKKTTEMVIDEKQLPLLGVNAAQEIFVDGYQGVHVKDGVSKIHFFTVSIDPTTGNATRRVAFTLVSSVVTLARIQAALGTLLEDLKRDGLLTEAAPVRTEKTDA